MSTKLSDRSQPTVGYTYREVTDPESQPQQQGHRWPHSTGLGDDYALPQPTCSSIQKQYEQLNAQPHLGPLNHPRTPPSIPSNWASLPLTQVCIYLPITSMTSPGTVAATTGSTLAATTGSLLAATTGIMLPATTGTMLPATKGMILPATTGIMLPTTTSMMLWATTGMILPAATGILLPATTGMMLPVDAQYTGLVGQGLDAAHRPVLPQPVIGAHTFCFPCSPGLHFMCWSAFLDKVLACVALDGKDLAHGCWSRTKCSVRLPRKAYGTLQIVWMECNVSSHRVCISLLAR